MNVNMSDKEQIQMFKDWWHKNGTFVIFLMVFFLLANIGLRYWKNRDTNYREHASTAYTQLLNAQQQKKTAEVQLFAKDLMDNYARSAYASLAAFMVAKNDIAANKLDVALQHLRWVVTHARSDELRTIANLRVARVLLAQRQPQLALAIVDKISDKAYAMAVAEIKGDCLVAMGKKQEALQFYSDAAAAGGSADIEVKSPLLEMKY